MAKLLLLLQLLLTFVVTVFGILPNSFHYPPGCLLPKCIYVVNFFKGISTRAPDRLDGITVVVNAKVENANQTMAGIGFSKEKNTKLIEVVYRGYYNHHFIGGNGLWENEKKIANLLSLGFKESTELLEDRLVFEFELIGPLGWNPREFTFNDSDCYHLVFLLQKGGFLENNISLKSFKKIVSDKPMCVKDLKPEEPRGGDVDTRTDGTEVYPRNCKEESCTTNVTWKLNLNKKVVKFQVLAKQDVNTYTGVGFSASGKGRGVINAIFAYKNSSGKTVVAHGKLLPNILEPKISNSQDLLNTKLVYKNGVWTLDFELKINPKNKDDIDLSKIPYYMVLLPEGGLLGRGDKLQTLLAEPEYSKRRISFVREDHAWRYNCNATECEYEALWEPDKDQVKFIVIARLSGIKKYTGIGLTESRDLSKVVFVYVKKLNDRDNPEFHNGIITNSSAPVDYNDTYLSGRVTDMDRGLQIVFMSFSFKRDKLDNKDFSLAPGKCYYLVFSYEGGDLSNDDLNPQPLEKYHITKEKTCFRPIVNCKNEKDGDKFPILGDCSKYIECIGQRPYTRFCNRRFGGALYFNPKTLNCTNIKDIPSERKRECRL